MTRSQALNELAEKFDARLSGLAYQALGTGSRASIPAETAAELARITVEWLDERGFAFENHDPL